MKILGKHLILILLMAAPVLAQQSESRRWEGVANLPKAFHGSGPVSARVALPAMEVKVAAPQVDGPGPLRVGTVRELPKSVAAGAWSAVAGGYVARVEISSEGALGLRARLRLPPGIVAGELRASGEAGPIEGHALGASPAGEAWTPWTEGPRQVIEAFSVALPLAPLAIEAIVHFDRSLTAKAAGSCNPDVACTSGDAALDSAIAEAKDAVARISYVRGSSSFLCSATLINTPQFPRAYLLTANHCISTQAVAASLTSMWFREATACGSGVASAGAVQVSGGATLAFTNYNVDSTLLTMNQPPPAGAVFAGLDPARLALGDAIVSISHPAGDVKKYALGTMSGELRTNAQPQDMYGVSFTRGVIEGGSSGSALFTRSGSGLKVRGVLTGTTLRNGVDGLSCTNLADQGLYPRLEIFHPEIARTIGVLPAITDDWPNQPPLGVAISPIPPAITEATFTGRLDYAGDLDVISFSVAREGALTVRTVDSGDTVGTLIDANGRALKAEDDIEAGHNDFGITQRVTAGTYHVLVGHFEAAGTGAYTLKVSHVPVEDNYTDLWWIPEESGWGVNVNHQGNILFATLFTYDNDGAGMWLVMSDGSRQPDGAYRGTLYRTTGPAFNAQPWSPISYQAVGTMQFVFSGTGAATLTYSVNGTQVTKNIVRQVFDKPPVCNWSGFDRSYARNYQDLWWNPAESGWGINLAHQGSVLFATLFTYAPGGRDMWLVMSAGRRQADGSYSGELYRTTGPVFNASPWVPFAAQQVGTMTLRFSSGNAGTLNYTVNGAPVAKSIVRQVFATPATECEAPN
jgi:hypothetical protein